MRPSRLESGAVLRTDDGGRVAQVRKVTPARLHQNNGVLLADEFAQAREVHTFFVEQHLDHRRAGDDAKFLRVELAASR
jgi:hypothetical protein